MAQPLEPSSWRRFPLQLGYPMDGHQQAKQQVHETAADAKSWMVFFSVFLSHSTDLVLLEVFSTTVSELHT